MPNDKLIHFLIYFCVMAWFAQLADRRGWLVILFVAMGFVLKLAQGQTRYRTFEWADFLANTAGVSIAWVAVMTPFGNSLNRLDRSLEGLLNKK